MRIYETAAAWRPSVIIAEWVRRHPGDPRSAKATGAIPDVLPPLALIIEDGQVPMIALRGYSTADAVVMGVCADGRPFAHRIAPRDGSAGALADAAQTQRPGFDAPLPPDLGECAESWASVASTRLAPDIPPPPPPPGARALMVNHVRWHARADDPARTDLERRLRIAAARVYAPAERALRAALDPERLRRAELLAGQDGWPLNVLDACAALMAAEVRHGPAVSAAIDAWPWFARHAIALAEAIQDGTPDPDAAAVILAQLGLASDPSVMRQLLPWFARHPLRTVDDLARAPFVPIPSLDLLAVAIEAKLDPGALEPDAWYRIEEAVKYRVAPAAAVAAEGIDILAKTLDAATVAIDRMCGGAMPPAFACCVLEDLSASLTDEEAVGLVADLAAAGDRAGVLARIKAAGRDPHAVAGAAVERMSRTHEAALAIEERGQQVSWDVRGRRTYGIIRRALRGVALAVAPDGGACLDVWRLSDPNGSLVRHADTAEVAAAAFAILARAASHDIEDQPEMSGHAAMRAAHLAHEVGVALGLEV